MRAQLLIAIFFSFPFFIFHLLVKSSSLGFFFFPWGVVQGVGLMIGESHVVLKSLLERYHSTEGKHLYLFACVIAHINTMMYAVLIGVKLSKCLQIEMNLVWVIWIKQREPCGLN